MVILSNNELEVMELLWSENRALTRTEIIDLSPNKSWKPSAIHVLLNSLLKKEAVRVDGFKPTGKNYGRTYAAAITPDEYGARTLKGQLPKEGRPEKLALTGVFSAMVHDKNLDKEDLLYMQRILDEKMKELEK